MVTQEIMERIPIRKVVNDTAARRLWRKRFVLNEAEYGELRYHEIVPPQTRVVDVPGYGDRSIQLDREIAAEFHVWEVRMQTAKGPLELCFRTDEQFIGWWCERYGEKDE